MHFAVAPRSIAREFRAPSAQTFVPQGPRASAARETRGEAAHHEAARWGGAAKYRSSTRP
jgi:hypothetical protein